jgi:hypothetical protein
VHSTERHFVEFRRYPFYFRCYCCDDLQISLVDIGAAAAGIGPLISLKRGLEASSTRKTTASVEWGHRGRASTTVAVRSDYDQSSDTRNPPPAVVRKRRRCSRKLKPDEEGEFREVVGRSDQDDITSPICLSGFVISLKNNAGHRIYWRSRQIAYELPANDDNGLDAMIKLGFVVLGTYIQSFYMSVL